MVESASDQRGFAADAVAEVAEEGGADGPGEEGDGEGGERGEGGGGGVGRGEEQLREDEHGGGGVDVEVEEFDGGADEAGEEDLRGRVEAWRGACVMESGCVNNGIAQANESLHQSARGVNSEA